MKLCTTVLLYLLINLFQGFTVDQLLSFSTAQALSTTASQQAGLSKAQISALEAAGATIYGAGMY